MENNEHNERIHKIETTVALMEFKIESYNIAHIEKFEELIRSIGDLIQSNKDNNNRQDLVENRHRMVVYTITGAISLFVLENIGLIEFIKAII